MTIPIELSDQLDMLSSTFQVSRSSLISEILSDTVTNMHDVVSLSLSVLEDGDKDAPTLSRNYAKVRSYLDSMRLVIDEKTEKLDTASVELLKLMEESLNEH
jgi:predicted DNA-binding protein